jgi:hypothetical protein
MASLRQLWREADSIQRRGAVAMVVLGVVLGFVVLVAS